MYKVTSIYTQYVSFYYENNNIGIKMQIFIFAPNERKAWTKKYYSLLSIIGLVLLLFLSPCKVRNFVQVELGVPQSNVSNKSQTTLSTISCLAFDVAEINHSSSTSVTKALTPVVNEKLFTFDSPIQSKAKNALRISKSKLIPSIPLYILYQNIQIYS